MNFIDNLRKSGARVDRGGNGAAPDSRIGFVLALESADIVHINNEPAYVLKGRAVTPAEGVAINDLVTVKMTPKVAESTLFHGMARSMLPAVTEGASEKHAGSEILVRAWKDKSGDFVGSLGTSMSTFLTNGRLLGAKPTSKVPERAVSAMLAGRPSITLISGQQRATARFEALAGNADSVRMFVNDGQSSQVLTVPIPAAVQSIREAIAEQLAINQKMIDQKIMIKPALRVDMPMYNALECKTVAAGEGATPGFASLENQQYLLEASGGNTFNLALLAKDDEQTRARKIANAEKFVRDQGPIDGVAQTVAVVPTTTLSFIKERAVKMAEAYANLLQNHYDPAPANATWSLASKLRPELRGWESVLSPSFHGIEKPFTPVVVSMVKFPVTDKGTGEMSTGYALENVLAQTPQSFESVLAAAAEISRISADPNEHLGLSVGASVEDISIDVSDIDVSDIDVSGIIDPALADALGEPIVPTTPSQSARRPRDLCM